MGKINKDFRCRDAELYYYDFIHNNSLVPEKFMDHINSCANCLKEIENLKSVIQDQEANTCDSNRNKINDLLRQHFNYVDTKVTCNEVKPFLPWLADSDLNIKIPTPINAHINSCPQCLRDLELVKCLNLDKPQLDTLAGVFQNKTNIDVAMPKLCGAKATFKNKQRIIDTIDVILDRSPSGVITVFSVDKTAKDDADDSLYAGFPVKVQKINRMPKDEQTMGANISFETNTVPKSTTAPFARLLKPAMVAAAAILIISFGLFFSTSAVNAVDITDIYNAIGEVQNIYVAKYTADNDKPIQQFWISKQSNLYLTKSSNKVILCNLNDGLRKVKLLDSNTVENYQLSGDRISAISQNMLNSFGMMPFTNISGVPADAKWEKISGDSFGDNIEIYDLLWGNQRLADSRGYWKCKFFVNNQTNLPFKIEVYRKSDIEEDYILLSFREIEYLSGSEFEIAIKGQGF